MIYIVTLKNLIFKSLILFFVFTLVVHSQDKNKVTNDTILETTSKLPLKAERKLKIDTNEGTWMSLDVSPDHQHIIFDFLGDLYEIPFSGGVATQITKGLPFDSNPRYSPDGKSILFLSDRSGGNNAWYIDRTEKDTLQITKGDTNNMQSACWSPDGEYVVVSKGTRNLKLHMHHLKGGEGVQLIKSPDNLKTVEPVFSPDGKLIWYAKRTGAWQYNASMPQYQLATYERGTGKIKQMTNKYGSAFSPTLSPDGKWLVYGSRYNDQTGLVKRNLISGEEAWLAYPVQRDEQESIAPLGVLPAMAFTPDSKEVVASYGGKIYRIPILGGEAIEIPFHVQTELDLGPRLAFTYPIEDTDTFDATQIRNPVLSPDNKSLAFTALNRLYVMDLKTRVSKRLTQNKFTEAMPSWSPDSKSLAFVTWETGKGGHVYTVNTMGKTRIKQISTQHGLYTEPVWTVNNRLVVFKGSSQTFQEATGPLAFAPHKDLIWFDLKKKNTEHFIFKAAGYYHPHFTSNTKRIYLNSSKGLVSIRWDGTDEKQHVLVEGITVYGSIFDDHHLLSDAEEVPVKKPSKASQITMAPDGDYALAQVHNELYAVKVPLAGAQAVKINVSNPKAAAFPAIKLTQFGGQFPTWNNDGQKVHWALGNTFFSYDIEAALSREKAIKKEKEAKKNEKDKKKEKDSIKAYQANEMLVKVPVKRDLPNGKYLLKNATLLTMSERGIIENGAILIEKNRIVKVGKNSDFTDLKEVKIFDCSGQYIMPGFVDTHAHMRPSWGLHKNEIWTYAANLAYGVTTTRDPQTGTTDVLTYADMVDAGTLIGPRIYSTGPGVGYWGYNIKSKAHASNVLKQYSKYYKTKTIKMYLTGNRKHRQWILEAAKEQKLMPTTEGGLDFKLNLTQIIDGYPGHEHAFPVYPLYKDFLTLVSEAQTAYTPTLLVAYGGPWAENYYYATEKVNDDQKLNRFTPKSELDAKSRRRNAGWFMKEEHVFDDHAVFVKELVEAGGISGVGSHGQLQGLGYHWELWSMFAGGIDAYDMLKVATIKGATAIGLQEDLGSLEKGKLADILILDENPLKNIRHTLTLDKVIKNGRVHDAATLDEVYPRQKKQNFTGWKQAAPNKTLPGVK